MAIVVITVDDDEKAIELAKKLSKDIPYTIAVWSSEKHAGIDNALLIASIHGFDVGKPDLVLNGRE